MDTVVDVEHLAKRYGDTVAVADVGFSVRRGEVFGMLGPNGAGKTTTVECLQGLRRRDTGEARVLGVDPETDPHRLRGRVGSQLQSSALPDRLRVGEAVGLFAALGPHPVDVAAVLGSWDLTRLRRRPFAALSGGERQRLFLALALLGDPEVVFLDELTTGLDPAARRATWDLVREVRYRGATIVLVTHLMEEAEALCDRVAVVDEGRVVALDTPDALVTGAGGDVSCSFTAPPTAGITGDLAFLGAVPGVRSVDRRGHRVTVVGDGESPVRVAATLAERGIVPADYRTHHPSLEDVFLALTGRSLVGGGRLGTGHEPAGEEASP